MYTHHNNPTGKESSCVQTGCASAISVFAVRNALAHCTAS